VFNTSDLPSKTRNVSGEPEGGTSICGFWFPADGGVPSPERADDVPKKANAKTIKKNCANKAFLLFIIICLVP
jgi:hypothetical protein